MPINNLGIYFQTCLNLLESAWTNMKSLKAKFRKTDVSIDFPAFLGISISAGLLSVYLDGMNVFGGLQAEEADAIMLHLLLVY